jgi:putative transposase
MKYRFIDAHCAVYPVGQMCRVLEVSRSGYYAWCKRVPSAREQSNRRLLVHIRAVYRASRKTYGSRRVYHELSAQGLACSRHRVARLMREDGLRAVQRQRYKQTTRANPRLPVAPNLLNQEFTAQSPDQKWPADFTYIPTAQGWLYVATVLDVCSRQIVGWSMSERQQSTLVEDALKMTLARRCPEAGLLPTPTVAASMPAATTRNYWRARAFRSA